MQSIEDVLKKDRIDGNGDPTRKLNVPEGPRQLYASRRRSIFGDTFIST